jgi:hypothetical protein
MKQTVLFFALAAFLQGCSPATNGPDQVSSADTTDATNDFYDNASVQLLANNGKIMVDGEVSEPHNVYFRDLKRRSVIVKETVLENGKEEFVGAYRYEGYSLYDLLNEVNVRKDNKEDFAPIIDLYVTITGSNGEETVLSWGEIYYPANRHQVLIATRVTPIVPSKTNDQWPLPEVSKLVVGTDLVTERNIPQPVTIRIHSLDAGYEVNREMDRLYAPRVEVFHGEDQVAALGDPPDELEEYSYPNTFYGRGKGIHGISEFRGYRLKDMLPGKGSQREDYIRRGIYTIAAPDGYRAAFTYSEIMNRNDQSEALMMDYGKGTEDGRWRLFMPADFFSDRAIKAVRQIRLELMD